ncbi:two-component system, CitB family, response regulator [Fictibacillus solisalsi]|uniref:Transcriptional regulatory protein n=1 Tax=Fictibacillus solisalsi TaxID=459525 RepID=A0A1G9XMX5_9BACL|nr:response regulator [Fictibacillus solisalsi]SDM98124.1 two-component system, CitB family, response regulator [Fictibacillus solisalsi]
MAKSQFPLHLLIVEDDIRIAEINRRFVEKVSGFSVVAIATTREEAHEQITCLQPDLILLDNYFPDMTGIELLKWIREEVPESDVIMVTAAKEIHVLKQAMKRGIFDYIVKPVMFDRFKETLLKYKQYKETINKLTCTNEWVDQEGIDRLLGKEPKAKQECHLPKGIDQLTLKKVLLVIQQHKKGLTAEEVGKDIGASRTTARRYLEYLVSTFEIDADLAYGSVGRPERIYRYVNH